MKSRKKSEITQELLRHLLIFNAGSGQFFWAVDRQGHAKAGDLAGHISRTTGYRDLFLAGRPYGAHRVVWFWLYGKWPNGQIDHINGVRLDNRPENLRDVSPAQNRQNLRVAHKDSKVGLLGVKRNGKGFSSAIQSNGRPRLLGTFATPEEAHQAYVVAKREVHPFGTL